MIELDIATGTCNAHASEDAEALTPAFFATFRRSSAPTPERHLMLAVLENAVMCYRRYARARDAHGRRRFEEARDWFASGDRSLLFSFESICDALDIHASYVRRNLSAPAMEETIQRDGRADRRRGSALRGPSASRGPLLLPHSLRASQAGGRRGQ
jgi:hypothetical protein